MDGKEVLPLEGATIVVKHLGVNSKTGKLCNPIYWRMKNRDDNELAHTQESVIIYQTKLIL